jgi:methionine-rich copper-binding protein CopC
MPAALTLLLATVVLFQQATVFAQLPGQPTNRSSSQITYMPATLAIVPESMPLDDSVLVVAPPEIGLNFPQRVRLVKLVLYNEKKEWVDINFRYNPSPGEKFNLPIPQLQPASYYTASWAILAANDMLVRGSFSFTFGPDAESPSVLKNRELMLIEMRNTLPEMQELQERLGLDPAEIIINNNEPRRFEPPFTPLLDQIQD